MPLIGARAAEAPKCDKRSRNASPDRLARGGVVSTCAIETSIGRAGLISAVWNWACADSGFLLPSWHMGFFSPFHPLLRGWLLSFVGWSLVGVVMAAQGVATRGDSWSMHLEPSVRTWLP